jgi:hypothetical protein
MASTDFVLAHAAVSLLVMVALLILRVVFWLVLLAATSLLAKRNGQKLTKLSWSFIHGFTAEFSEPEDHRAESN